MSLLHCQSLVKRFGALAALDDLGFAVAKGEILGIGGPNGAGKTTLFEVISGFQAPDAGSVSLSGEEITGQPAQRIVGRGLVRLFQANTEFDSLSVLENVMVGAIYGDGRRLPPLATPRRARTAAEAALERVGLAEKRARNAASLPVLDRKLLMLASALAAQPRILLLDEPVGGLNPSEMDRFGAQVSALRDEGLSILLIEHVMRFMVRFADRVMIMHHGRKIYEGPADGLTQNQTVATAYLGAGAAKRLGDYLKERAA